MSWDSWWVVLVVMSCVLGLWALAIIVLRRLSQQLDDEPGAAPFSSLSSMLENERSDSPGPRGRSGAARQEDIVTAGNED